MKKTSRKWAILASVVLLTACSGFQESVYDTTMIDATQIPEEVRKSFTDNYPQISQHRWEMVHGNYVVDFKINGRDMEIWFDMQGNLVRVETDITYAELPAEVKAAHEASAYATWRVEDVDKIESPTKETVYELEVEKGEQDLTLIYTASGSPVTNISGEGTPGEGTPGEGTPGNETGNGNQPGGGNGEQPGGGPGNGDDQDIPNNAVPQVVAAAFLAKYPTATRVEWEQKNGRYKAECYVNGFETDVCFEADGTWKYTETEMTYAALPQEVKDAFLASTYAGWRVEDVTRWEFNDKADKYILEVERGESEATWSY